MYHINIVLINAITIIIAIAIIIISISASIAVALGCSGENPAACLRERTHEEIVDVQDQVNPDDDFDQRSLFEAEDSLKTRPSSSV